MALELIFLDTDEDCLSQLIVEKENGFERKLSNRIRNVLYKIGTFLIRCVYSYRTYQIRKKLRNIELFIVEHLKREEDPFQILHDILDYPVRYMQESEEIFVTFKGWRPSLLIIHRQIEEEDSFEDVVRALIVFPNDRVNLKI